MTVEDAIKDLTDHVEGSRFQFRENQKTALLMGIESLKRVQVERRQGYVPSLSLLSGETPSKAESVNTNP